MDGHYRAMRVMGMRAAADIAEQFAQEDLALSKRITTDEDLAAEYRNKAARGFLIAGAIRAKAAEEERGPTKEER